MTLPRRRWVLATSNPGKVAELQALLAESGHTGEEIVAQASLGVDSPPETGVTFLENALLKARHASRITGLPAIADDSGLTVDALGGAPGVHSARYAGPGADDQANVTKLLRELAGVPGQQRGASFHCVVVALRFPDDPLPRVAHGEWPGAIAAAPRGQGGFGYDPVFLVPSLGATAAQLPPETKNRLSHRGQAFRRLAEALASDA